ncbi:M48 family metalloprotease [Streptosporangium roseum]|uniref:M48 family metalloprotease n=1 Tax=Streptosporangium roseum TaxID=2001 RepID=UPI00331E1C02
MNSSTAGLAELTATLRRAARLPGLLVYIAPELGDNAYAGSRPCGPAPLVGIGADLLDDSRSAALHGAVAHEIAHHALGHVTSLVVPALERVAAWATVGAMLATIVPAPRWVPLVLVAVAAVAYVTAAWRRRATEYAADAHAVALLDAAGLPGAAIVAAMLTEDFATEPRWYARGGWLIGSHPLTRSRLRRITSLDQLTPQFTAPGFAGGAR